jgi:hypothetical protein
MQTLSILSILNEILLNVLLDCPTIIISDFNINMLSTTIQSKLLQDFTKKYHFNITFTKITHVCNKQIDHVWTNAPIEQCYSKSTYVYWTYRKPIYFTFKLSNHVPHLVLSWII